MDMLQSRNKTSHTYNEETAADSVTSIKDELYSLFCTLKDDMEKRAKTGE